MTKFKVLLIFFLVLFFSCNSSQNQNNSQKKTAKELIKIDTVKVDKTTNTFYAICADEHFGWCSKVVSTYDEADSILQDHRKSTGHTDNTVSNDCPF